METTKPYMMNVTRVGALPISLLFAQDIIISPDMRNLVIDEWLHIEFQSVDEAVNILPRAIWLRNQWANVVSRQLKVFNALRQLFAKSNHVSTEVVQSFIGTSFDGSAPATGKIDHELRSAFQKLEHVPELMRNIRRDWIQLVEKGRLEHEDTLKNDDVMDRLAELVGLDVNYTVERLKMQALEAMFDADPFAIEAESSFVELTPNFRYFMPSTGTRYEADEVLFKLPVVIPNAFEILPQGRSMNVEVAEEHVPVTQDYACPICATTYRFTTPQIFRHRKQCMTNNQ
jgi:hypothetical protein